VLVTTCVGYQGGVLSVLRSLQEFLVDRAGLKQLLMDPPGFIGRLTAFGIVSSGDHRVGSHYIFRWTQAISVR
jgi:hypothetical protein